MCGATILLEIMMHGEADRKKNEIYREREREKERERERERKKKRERISPSN